MVDTNRSQYRLPIPLHERLQAAASESGRSINAEVVARLEHSFDVPALVQAAIVALFESRDPKVVAALEGLRNAPDRAERPAKGRAKG